MKKEDVLKSIELLTSEIDENIALTVKARLNKDEGEEKRQSIRRETLINDSMQELTFLYDYILEKVGDL